LLAALSLAGTALVTDPSYRNRDNSNPNDEGDGGYAIPYQKPTPAEIQADIRQCWCWRIPLTRPRSPELR
jgi:hypothetical protein